MLNQAAIQDVAGRIPTSEGTLQVKLKDWTKTFKTQALPVGMQILDRLAPNSAAALAEKIFLTPPKLPRNGSETAMLKTGHRFHVPFRGMKLAAWSWNSGEKDAKSKGTVLFIHGWGGRGGQFYEWISPMVKAGYNVVVMDASGHGDSGGKQSSLPEFRDAILAVGESVGPLHAVIGHSMGAAAATAAVHSGLQAKRVVLLGSPMSLFEYTDKYTQWLGLSEKSRLRMQARMEKRFQTSWHSLTLERIVPLIQVPGLVIHDRGDRDAPYENGMSIHQLWKNSQLYTTVGLGHYRILRAKPVIERALEFLREAA
ncbi:MAG: alpha/beta hydrolase [Bdellovibrionales bacterium]|nr:alpha/beta hydrolase [Bdellovibrionales bacterium]